MGLLIDANVLMDAERGLLDLNHAIRGQEDEEFFLSVITASELLHGVFRAKADVRNRRSAFVEGILERFPLLPIDLTVARMHAQIWANLQNKGTLIGPHDLWLAATCIAYGYRLVTRNIAEFKKIAGLKVEQW